MHTQAILNLYAQLLAPNLGETSLRFQAKLRIGVLEQERLVGDK
jgi:hypothetical protein